MLRTTLYTLFENGKSIQGTNAMNLGRKSAASMTEDFDSVVDAGAEAQGSICAD